jgi:hypothetical protein
MQNWEEIGKTQEGPLKSKSVLMQYKNIVYKKYWSGYFSCGHTWKPKQLHCYAK